MTNPNHPLPGSSGKWFLIPEGPFFFLKGGGGGGENERDNVISGTRLSQVVKEQEDGEGEQLLFSFQKKRESNNIAEL